MTIQTIFHIVLKNQKKKIKTLLYYNKLNLILF